MNQAKRWLFLLQSLLKEKTEYREIAIPPEADDQRLLLRGLMNIRTSRESSLDFLRVQDEYLQEESRAKGITDLADLTPTKPGMYL